MLLDNYFQTSEDTYAGVLQDYKSKSGDVGKVCAEGGVHPRQSVGSVVRVHRTAFEIHVV